MKVLRWAGVLWALILAAGCTEGHEERSPREDITAFLKRISRSFCSELTVTPTDDTLYWRVGEVKEMWCSVGQAEDSLTSDNLTIFKSGVALPHQTVNETTIRVTLNLTQPESYKLICTGYLQTQMCMTQVHVGYEPLEVEDLQCVSHNWESFTCNWTIPFNPVQDDDYRPYLTSPEYPGLQTCTCNDYYNYLGDSCKCPDTCCLWSSESYPSISPRVTVMFVAENNLGAATFNYTIDNYAVVLPDPMNKVAVESAAGKLEALVTWELPTLMGTFAEEAAGVVVRVDHRLTDDGAGGKGKWIQGEVVLCHGDPACKNGQQVMPLEHWWRRYEVRVRLRSAAAPQPPEEDGWWSDWQPRYVNTSAAAPDALPGVGPGSFQVVWRGFAGLSDVTLVWQTLPTLLHNGPDFGYLAQLCSGAELRSEVLKEVFVTGNSAVFENVSSSESYTLRVSAHNSEGGGPWSPVRVAAEEERLAPPLLPVVVQHSGAEQQDVLYELRWFPEDEGNYTAYLCTGVHEGARPCTGQLYWISMGNVSAVNLTLRDFGLQDAAPPQVSFGVSVENAVGVSSGLSLDRCGTPEPYRNSRGPPEPGDPTATSSGVDLPWTLSCNFWADVVEEAEAICCLGAQVSPDNCTGEQVPATGQPWTGLVRVKGLEAGEEYTAWLRLRYRGGTSPWADGQTFTTKTAGVELWLIVVVGVVGMLATVVFVIGLVYSKRKFVDNLKKFRLKPSLPSGLVPTGRQQEPNASFRGPGGGVGKGGDGGAGGKGGGVPVSQSTVSSSVKSPGYAHILPTAFGRRPSLSLKDQEMEEDVSFGRGVTQGGKLTIQQHQQLNRSGGDNNLLSTGEERSTLVGGTVVSSESSECLLSPSTSEPLLQKSLTQHYISPYFSESEGEGRDTYSENPLSPGGYVGVSGPWSGGGEGSGGSSQSTSTGTWYGGKSNVSSSSGGNSGYIPPSECSKLPGMSVTPVSSGYVTAQYGDDIAAASPGYVQADAIPHQLIIPDSDNGCKNPCESGLYVSVDLPMVVTGQTPASPGMADKTPDPVATSADCTSHVPKVSLKGDVDDTEEQKQIEKPSYVSLPDAQLSMEWTGGKFTDPSEDKLSVKGSVSHEEPPRPANDPLAPGYIAVQPPDFGKHVQKEDTEIKFGGKGTVGYDPDFLSQLLSKSSNPVQGSPACLVSPVLPVSTPGADSVPCEARNSDVSHWAGSTGGDGYVPLSIASADDSTEKGNAGFGVNSWFASVVSPSRACMTPEARPTDISFVMLDNPSRASSVSGGTEVKETSLDSMIVQANEGPAGEGEEGEGAQNENILIDDLPQGYSRIGEPPE